MWVSRAAGARRWPALPQKEGRGLSFLTRVLWGSLPSVQTFAWNRPPSHSDEIPNKCSDSGEHKALIFPQLLAFTVNSIWITSHLHAHDSCAHYDELCLLKCTKQRGVGLQAMRSQGNIELGSNGESYFVSLHILYSSSVILQGNENIFKKIYVCFYWLLEREGEGERQMSSGEKHRSDASCTPLIGDRACNSGVCLVWESNQWPPGSWVDANHWAHQLGGNIF